MGRIRVLVADGHRIFAEALATALAAEPDIEVSAAGSTHAAERALDRAVAENRPYQVLLVDADLAPGGPVPPGDSRPQPGQLQGPGAANLPAQNGSAGPGPAGGHPSGQPTGHPSGHSTGHPGTPLQPGFGPRASVPLPAQRRSGTGARIAPPVSAPATVPNRPRIPGQRPEGQTPAPGRSAGAPDGIALVGRARAAHPDLRAVVLATDDDPRRTVRALQAGASGWVAKESSLGRLTAIVRGVLRDETHIPPLLLTGVVRELTAARRDRTESERLVESLTPREKQVLRCMVAGLGRQAVADRLYLSPHTVRTHMQNVLGKLNVHSTLAAVAVARRAGIGPSTEGPQ